MPRLQLVDALLLKHPQLSRLSFMKSLAVQTRLSAVQISNPGDVVSLPPALGDSASAAAAAPAAPRRPGGKQPCIHLYFDGGSRRNPGHAGSGFVISTEANAFVSAGWCYEGPAQTNNHAEYFGLIRGLRRCKELELKQVACHGDSELVVKQLKGKYMVRAEHLKPLHRQALELMRALQAKIVHVPRGGGDCLPRSSLTPLAQRPMPWRTSCRMWPWIVDRKAGSTRCAAGSFPWILSERPLPWKGATNSPMPSLRTAEASGATRSCMSDRRWPMRTVISLRHTRPSS
jgi:ribonuclease HI